jgi:cation transport ATPase
MSSLTFEIFGMHCGACVRRVQNAFAHSAEHVHVTLNPPRLMLDNPRTQDVQQLHAIATHTGYRITPVQAPLPMAAEPLPPADLARYKPLAILLAFVLLASLITPLREAAFSAHAWMHDFMGAFFMVFALFKLLDVRGFANAFAQYDPLAKRWPAYGLVYPFIELALGLAFLLYWQPVAAAAVAMVVLGITTVGVVRVLLDKQSIQCACIGTGFNLPMSTVTIVENTLMIAMSVWMIARVL